jgi:hypothetical protein
MSSDLIQKKCAFTILTRHTRLIKKEEGMSQHVLIEIELPTDLEQFQLPEGVNKRLQTLLDRQDHGKTLTRAERQETEGLVDLAEWLSLLRLRAQRVGQHTDSATDSLRR